MEADLKSFDEKFEKIYEQICEKCEGKLKENRDKLNRILLIVMGVLVIINIIIYISVRRLEISILALTISFCIMLFLVIQRREIYKKSYKNYVISELIKSYNPKLYYDAKYGLSKFNYKMSNFDNSFDEFFSEDQIHGKLEDGTDVRISEVATFIIEENKSGDQTYKSKKETFRGMYGMIKMPYNITSSIYIYNDSIIERFNRDRIEIDSAEFEKYYDCISEEKIRALRILTSDVIEKFVDIRHYSKNGFELKIENDMIYFRFKCGQIFEPPTFGSGLDKELVKKYYGYIYFPMEIIVKLSENISDFIKEE